MGNDAPGCNVLQSTPSWACSNLSARRDHGGSALGETAMFRFASFGSAFVALTLCTAAPAWATAFGFVTFDDGSQVEVSVEATLGEPPVSEEDVLEQALDLTVPPASADGTTLLDFGEALTEAVGGDITTATTAGDDPSAVITLESEGQWAYRVVLSPGYGDGPYHGGVGACPSPRREVIDEVPWQDGCPEDR